MSGNKKYVYDFEEGGEHLRRLLGGKGAGLAEMTRAGLPVPPGFTITTEACKEYYKRGPKFIDEIWPEIMEHFRKLEKKTGKKFGDKNNPLLVSVRSGAPVSMPGMMDTILNVGLNDETVEALARLTNNPRFAYDCYRRLIQMFGSIVMGIDRRKFEETLEEIKKKYGVKYDAELSAEAMKEVVKKFKEIYKKETGEDFPQDPFVQLRRAIETVFKSWNNPRAIKYREIHKIPHDMGTAVNVQMMVFGNFGWDSGTGVCFTRNPATGEKELYGEFLPNAQGEDVVAGIRTPYSIKDLKDRLPDVYKQLVEVAELLERHYKDMQDIEFTVEKGKLWLLQTRTGKRTAMAAIKIAVDMAREGIITKEEAIMRVKPEHIQQLLHRQIDPKAKEQHRPIARGLPASPGAAVGKVIFSSEEAEELGKRGEKVILVRPETTPEDIGGMAAAQGILTARGGMTSHAAVVARAMGKPAVVGAEMIHIDLEKEEFRVGDVVVKKGDVITIDGTAGEVYVGELPTIEPKLTSEALELLSWCDEYRKLGIRANADTPEEMRRALEFGAEGVGLTRTENMFVKGGRTDIVYEILLAETEEERRKALEKLIPLQKQDFKEILEVMDGKPVIVRLLDVQFYALVFADPEQLIEQYYKKKYEEGAGSEELMRLENLIHRVRAIRDADPQMGFRACRLGIVYPEVYEAQMRAAIEAAAELKKEGKNPILEIMVPGTAEPNELRFIRRIFEKVLKEVSEKYDVELDVKYGTMIESPRAALLADEMAEICDFFSFGTNDLTQFTFGWSRDDAERAFIHAYLKKKVLPYNPFQTLDDKGVAKLMEWAVKNARKVKPDIELGICGEHGGEPRSIEICHKVGLDYVSASPWRIPVARLVAAQAAIKEKQQKE
ncbi:MAG: pyruvate, phosphate dikinase [Candidatus Njordarchaeales archaeon]